MEYFKPKEGAVYRLLPPWDEEHEYWQRPETAHPCTSESKFGFGCPFCEAFLDLYPEDRGEGGIE